ncbi:MbtH family NRPS accessory protein [Massilia sp. UMI-21]|nr:MbtH family NRPS accessory protein [Massilia sp. UMI-21]
MIDEQNADSRVYIVLVNDEEQYSLWPRNQDVPAGWRSIDFSGTKDECMKHVDEIWTDMRPKSLRDRMAAAA